MLSYNLIKFGGNINDRCGNLTKKTELKSVDSEHHLMVIPGTFWSRWYIHVGYFDALCEHSIWNLRDEKVRNSADWLLHDSFCIPQSYSESCDFLRSFFTISELPESWPERYRNDTELTKYHVDCRLLLMVDNFEEEN